VSTSLAPSPDPAPTIGDRAPARVRERRSGLAAVAAVNAALAWGGAVALATGGIELGRRLDGRLPFDSPVLAAVAMALVVAAPLTALTWCAWRGAARTNDVSLVTGLLLIGWIVVQMAVLWAFSPFQPLYVGVGASLIAASHRLHLPAGARGALLVAVGALVAATAVGLLPHLVGGWSDVGSAVASTLVVVVLLVGVVLVVAGARAALRRRRLSGRLAGGVATVVGVVLVVWVVAPAVAATHPHDSHVTSTPAAYGLDYDAVTLTTADGVDLAAWYVPGSNGAGVVVLHGAGSTRSDALGQAAALVHAGYSALLVDARGHGDSGGSAMDFGWFGDLDVAAGLDHLAARPEIEPGRIGLLGLSMGGEEAIGAAAADPRVRAVVAEGATGRQAADKHWYSDVYGWRGWLQEQLEKVQYGIVDLLSEASPPIPLRLAVSRAVGARFLLITAGDVADEAHAAAHLRAAAPDRVTVWTVDGAGHTGGYETQPERWTDVVVGFLDGNLG
jgi:hypothetical protein